MEKFFNTAGPIAPDIHYYVDAKERWDFFQVLSLIAQRKYFILHAPRQTGKTSALLALVEYLNDSGQYEAVYANIEAAQAARENTKSAMEVIAGQIASRHQLYLKSDLLVNSWITIFKNQGHHQVVTNLLSFWANNSKKPTILFLDEVDALIGDTLISLLRQIRAGYDKRPANFPISITDYLWYIKPNGSLDIFKLLESFQDFFRKNSEHWLEVYDYKEAGPQLLLQAYLQRIVNGGGRIEREYGFGRGRTDLFIEYFYGDNQKQEIVLELKILYNSMESTIEEGLTQIKGYMDKYGTNEGHLLIFDRRSNRTWEEKIWDKKIEGIHVWGC